ncbi:hypothetical protein [Actinomadura opuntiae]|uniref:hypothetical protein n=1 Tax=Actinomadura sp. OS1-43 TaxID=604315 RepID=UPI00255AC786|nr:hypothetical protein [Actinomadura sp. OS1-43]MDL4817677.1 hypothetical protein [Actinomadura sp. OS1-43]
MLVDEDTVGEPPLSPLELEGPAGCDQRSVSFFKNSRQSRMSATIDIVNSSTKAAGTSILLSDIPEIASHDPVELFMTPTDRHLRFTSPALRALTANDIAPQNSITNPQARFGSLLMSPTIADQKK